jgi:hypothetical protein
MAKIDRKHQKIFADLGYTGNLGQFGSYAEGAPVYSNDPDVLQQLSNFGAGIGSALINSAPPALQDMNGLGYLLTKQLSYLFQAGISEWNASTSYYIGSLVHDGAGSVYISVSDTNLNQALSVETKWMILKSNKVRVSTDSVIEILYNDWFVLANASSGSFPVLVFLPAAASTNKGRIVTLKKLIPTATGSIQVQSYSGNIDGSATLSISTIYTTTRFLCDGANWHTI